MYRKLLEQHLCLLLFYHVLYRKLLCAMYYTAYSQLIPFFRMLLEQHLYMVCTNIGSFPAQTCQFRKIDINRNLSISNTYCLLYIYSMFVSLVQSKHWIRKCRSGTKSKPLHFDPSCIWIIEVVGPIYILLLIDTVNPNTRFDQFCICILKVLDGIYTPVILYSKRK
jgi:hypothetical protein